LHLNNLVSFLIQQLSSPNKEIQATTCWTLSKFSEWIGNIEDLSFFKEFHRMLVELAGSNEEKV